MKVTVDAASCQGHGMCIFACPEVFKYDDDGFAYVESEDVPAGLEDKAQLAEIQCPERAIKIVE